MTDESAAIDAMATKVKSAWRGAEQSGHNAERRVLGAFAHAMKTAAEAGMWDVVWTPPEAARTFEEAFAAIGASEIAAEIREISPQDPYSGIARSRLKRLDERVRVERLSLWAMALAYAERRHLLSEDAQA
jgi:hypothetical protein